MVTADIRDMGKRSRGGALDGRAEKERSQMIGDTDIEEIATFLPPPEPPKVKRRSPADKWDAQSLHERAETLAKMCQLRMLMEDPDAVRAMVLGREDEHDTRFSALTFDVQEKVESYIRKNYDDLA